MTMKADFTGPTDAGGLADELEALAARVRKMEGRKASAAARDPGDAGADDAAGAGEAVDPALAALIAAADYEDGLPAAEANRIMRAGEHPLRVWREHRGLTMTALGKAAGVPQSYISEVEAGKKIGSVDFYRRTADALGLLVDDLLPPVAGG